MIKNTFLLKSDVVLTVLLLLVGLVVSGGATGDALAVGLCLMSVE